MQDDVIMAALRRAWIGTTTGIACVNVADAYDRQKTVDWLVRETKTSRQTVAKELAEFGSRHPEILFIDLNIDSAL